LGACCYLIVFERFVVIFWKARAGRADDFALGGFVEAEVFVDGGESAEEQAGDLGESGGAARGDASAGEKFVEGREGVVDTLGILEVTGVLGCIWEIERRSLRVV
jgi:hypothetical protein